uniref:Fatty acid hydroxylase domain-containing protein n=1 Tax=Paramoeba aestuarina TaxID=180227 RepID=A0A7S4PKJ9_9EUKA
MASTLARILSFCFWALFLFCSVSEAAITLAKDAAVCLLCMDEPQDVAVSSAFVFVAYGFQYLSFSSLLEFTNPRGAYSSTSSQKEKDRRAKQIAAEMKIGVQALLITVVLTICWMYFIEPYTYFFGYFKENEYNIWWFLGSIVAYAFWFDTYFFFTHKWLHEYDWLWHKVHYIHHQYKEPSAFAQFATHPIEAALQGPVGHYCPTLFFPFHPVALAVFGFLSSLWAMAAHDGRWMDFNSHYYHHSKGRGRFNYFNLAFLLPLWDIIYGTRLITK